jgi:hypothetical protein
MVPTLGIKKDCLDENNCINAFCSDSKRDVQYENAVYLLFKPLDLDKFKNFLDEERERTKMLIDDYDYKGGYIVLVYQLDKKWEKDFNLIKQGKYSKTSDDFQQIFPKVKKIVVEGKHADQISLQWRIFKKTEDMRDFWENDEKWGSGVRFTENMEVWPMWNWEKEILNIDKINE